MSLGFALPRLLLPAWRPSLALPAPFPECQGLPSCSPPRLAMCSPPRHHLEPPERPGGQVREGRGAPRCHLAPHRGPRSSRGDPRSLGSRSKPRFSFDSEPNLASRRSLGQTAKAPAWPGKMHDPASPFATTSTGACESNAEERKASPRQGRPGPASPEKSPPAMRPHGPGGERGPGPHRCARPPRRAPYP